MTTKLPKIYPITDARLAGVSNVEQVRQLIAGGARFIQIRSKTATSLAFYSEMIEIMKIARDADARIIVNDRADIVISCGAAGVHLGQDDLPADRVRELLGPGSIIGLSTHSVEQARAAIRLPIDYIAIGPVFATATKLRADEVVGLDAIRRVRDEIGDIPLVAIGGITKDRIADVLASGADSAAIISDLLTATDIARRHAELSGIDRCA